MESFPQVVTTTFLALLAVLLVFGVGYIFPPAKAKVLSQALLNLARRILLPALVITHFASASNLSITRLLSLWPLAAFAATTHLLSLLLAVACCRFGSCPEWIIESLTFNNVSSFPLLTWAAMYHASSETAGLGHLRWRIMDTPEKVFERGVTYILVNLVIVELARTALSPLINHLMLTHLQPPVLKLEETPSSEDGFDDEDPPPAPSETTPLLPSSPATSTTTSSTFTSLYPLILAAAAGLAISTIPPVKAWLVGSEGGSASWVWESVGTGLGLLGGAYAVVEMVGVGAGLKGGSEKSEEEIPPTLGMVLLITFWRYVALPAGTISMMYGCRKLFSTRVFLQDPVFSFILATTSISPPALPTSLTPYRASVHLATTLLSLLSSLSLPSALAVTTHTITLPSFSLRTALLSALGGGIAGAAAMIVQVLTLMPLRTIMNYQYRFGGGFVNAVKTLKGEGGVRRYYAGLGAALFQGPLSRFGDTAANAFIFTLLSSLPWPVLVKTIFASLSAALFRMTLTPIDTLKTTQQTQGARAGVRLLRERVGRYGVGCLWWGAWATAVATFVGNYLQLLVVRSTPSSHPHPKTSPFIGFLASLVSDTTSNSLRVVKTYRQVSATSVGYIQAAREIVAAEGVLALFGRGLPTRLATNGLQGLLFSVLWKLFGDLISGEGKM